MKKNNILGIAVIALLAISACSNKSSESGSKIIIPGGTREEADKNGWTDSEKALMNKYIHIELPFFQNEGSEYLKYDTNDKYIYLLGGEVDDTRKLANYATEYTTAGYSGGEDNSTPGFYFYEKVLDEGTVTVNFYCLDKSEEDGPEFYSSLGIGDFWLVASFDDTRKEPSTDSSTDSSTESTSDPSIEPDIEGDSDSDIVSSFPSAKYNEWLALLGLQNQTTAPSISLSAVSEWYYEYLANNDEYFTYFYVEIDGAYDSDLIAQLTDWEYEYGITYFDEVYGYYGFDPANEIYFELATVEDEVGEFTFVQFFLVDEVGEYLEPIDPSTEEIFVQDTSASFPTEAFVEWLTYLELENSADRLSLSLTGVNEWSYEYILNSEFYYSYFYFEIEGIYDAEIATQLEGWTINQGTTLLSGYDGYYGFDSSELLYFELISGEDDEGEFTYAAIYVVEEIAEILEPVEPIEPDGYYDEDFVEAFPSDVVSLFKENVAPDVNFPTFYNAGDEWYYYIVYGSEIYYTELMISAFDDYLNNFKGTLSSAGWTMHSGYCEMNDAEGFFGSDPTGTIYFELYLDEDEYGVYATVDYLLVSEVGYIEPEDTPSEGMTFDLTSSSQITEKSGQKSVWTNGGATMTVEKGESTVDVGNGNYFADPLRLYTGQIVTFAWTGEAPSTITIECVEKGTSGFVDGGATGCSLSATGDTVTITVTGSTSCSIVISAQVRITSVTYDSESGSGTGTGSGTGDVEPVTPPVTGKKVVLDLTTTNLITEKGTQKTIWTNGEATMTVEKGEATVDVGNGNFFADPLRLYAGQVITFAWTGDAPSTITVECVDKGTSGLVDGAATGCSLSATGDTATITVTGSTSCSIVISAQVRITSATFNY